MLFTEERRSRLVLIAKTLHLLLALLAFASLVAEYGFYLPPKWNWYTQQATFLVLYGFVLIGLLRWFLAEYPFQYIRTRWLDSLLTVVILLYLFLPSAVESILLSINPLLKPSDLARLYLAITQALVVLAFVPSALRYSKRLMTMSIQPAVLILLSFLLLVVMGTLLLLLPRATASHTMPFIDALFTATSAVCVTGLIVVDTATYFTSFGHTILMILMQVGGLGIMTLTTFFAFILGGGTRLKEYSTLQSLLGEESLGQIKRTIIGIAIVTFVFEAVGAIALYHFMDTMSFSNDAERVFFSIFHSISGFCNAGFTLTTENLAHTGLRNNAGVLITIILLIILGGLGFPVLVNLGSVLVSWRKGGVRARLTVHTKLVLIMSLILILLGTAALVLLEQGKTLSPLSTGEQLLASVFHSVSARTAGFNTLDIGALGVPTLFVMILLMWIGASPGSTGGGVKTSTVALALLNIYAVASGRNALEVFRKRISTIAITKAFSTVLLSFFFINAALFCLLLTEQAPVEQLLFEVVSATSTVGLSTGITSHLTTGGKSIIIACMLIGRVGFFAFIVALTKHREEGYYEYTEENVLVT